MNRSRTQQRLVLMSLLFLGACTTPFPGHRHEGQGPDERLGVLMREHLEGRHQYRSEKERSRLGAELVDADGTLRDLRQLHLEYPTHTPTLFALAALAFKKGTRGRASGYLDLLFEHEPRHPEAGILRSRMAIGEGNLPASRRVLTQQIRYTPDHAGLQEALSASAYLEGNLVEARASLAMAERLGAPAWRVAFNRGLIEEAAGHVAEALQAYEAVMQAKPDCAAATSRWRGLRAQAGETIR